MRALFKSNSWQRILYIMLFFQFVSAMGFSIISPFFPLYVQALGTNTNLSLEFWAGMVFSAQAVTMMIASPIWGAVADRYGRKLMVARAAFGGSILVLMMGFVSSVGSATRAVAPLAGAAIAVWFGLSGAFVMAGLLLVVTAALAVRWLPYYNPQPQPQAALAAKS